MQTKEIYAIRPKIRKVINTEVADPDYGDFNLQLHPISKPLPSGFERWDRLVYLMINLAPYSKGSSNEHYITITSRYFTEDDTLRREGIHIDGNFCADPEFSGATWGGTTTTWGGTKLTPDLQVHTRWKSPYGITPPIGKYVSSELGGIIAASSLEGCEAWVGGFDAHVGDEGDMKHMYGMLNGRVVLNRNAVYFMSSDTPHRSIPIGKGCRRTLVRMTLAHDYPNDKVLNLDA